MGFQDIIAALSNPARRGELIHRNRLNIILYICALVVVLMVYHFLSDQDFSFLLTLGGFARLIAFCFLLVRIHVDKNITGISLKTLELYVLVFFFRLCSILFYPGYLPFDSSGDWFYQSVESLSLILVMFLVYLIAVPYSSQYNAAEDGFGKVKNIPNQFGPVLLVAPVFILAVLFHPSLNRNYLTDISWTFALYLESVAIVPQFYLLQKSNRAVEPWVAHFVFTIGLSRLFLAVFWYSSRHELNDHDAIGITGGWAGLLVILCQLIHLAVMAEFCYYYIKSSVDNSPLILPGLQV